VRLRSYRDAVIRPEPGDTSRSPLFLKDAHMKWHSRLPIFAGAVYLSAVVAVVGKPSHHRLDP
jgi:hypothetical protein